MVQNLFCGANLSFSSVSETTQTDLGIAGAGTSAAWAEAAAEAMAMRREIDISETSAKGISEGASTPF